MKSLLESFKELNQCYYNASSRTIKIEKFENSNCLNFIKEYFKAGEKENLIKELEISDHFESNRAEHSVSVYLIGLLAYKTIQNAIQKQLADHTESHFSYLWFLICLYHDYNTKCESIEPNEISAKYNTISQEEIIDNIRNIDERKWGNRYSANLVFSYLNLKRGRDHGIIAGALLRKRLIENLNSVIERNPNADKNGFIYNGLYWSIKHIESYDYASSMIMKHNIWFANSDLKEDEVDLATFEENMKNLNIYKSQHDSPLNSLVINNANRISFNEDPLLFIFSIIDTIEPLKTANKIKNIDNICNTQLLDQISFEFSEGNISLHGNNKLVSFYEETFSKAKGLELWLNLTVIKKDIIEDDRFNWHINISWEI